MVEHRSRELAPAAVEHRADYVKRLLLPWVMKDLGRYVYQGAQHLCQLPVILRGLLLDQVVELGGQGLTVARVGAHAEQAVEQHRIEEVLAAEGLLRLVVEDVPQDPDLEPEQFLDVALGGRRGLTSSDSLRHGTFLSSRPGHRPLCASELVRLLPGLLDPLPRKRQREWALDEVQKAQQNRGRGQLRREDAPRWSLLEFRGIQVDELNQVEKILLQPGDLVRMGGEGHGLGRRHRLGVALSLAFGHQRRFGLPLRSLLTVLEVCALRLLA